MTERLTNEQLEDIEWHLGIAAERGLMHEDLRHLAAASIGSLLAEVREGRKASTPEAHYLTCPRCGEDCTTIPATHREPCGYCATGVYVGWQDGHVGVCECGAALRVSVHEEGSELVALGWAEDCECEGYGVDDDGKPCTECTTYAHARKPAEGGAS